MINSIKDELSRITGIMSDDISYLYSMLFIKDTEDKNKETENICKKEVVDIDKWFNSL